MQKQKGLTLIGMLLTMSTIIIMGIVIIRVVPVYLENYEVVRSMQTLNTLPAADFSTDPEMNANILRTKLLNQLYVNSIESITPEQIKMTPDDYGNFQVAIKYQVTKPLVANVSLLFDFDLSQEVKISAE